MQMSQRVYFASFKQNQEFYAWSSTLQTSDKFSIYWEAIPTLCTYCASLCILYVRPLSIHPSIYLSIHPFVRLFIHSFILKTQRKPHSLVTVVWCCHPLSDCEKSWRWAPGFRKNHHVFDFIWIIFYLSKHQEPFSKMKLFRYEVFVHSSQFGWKVETSKIHTK